MKKAVVFTILVIAILVYFIWPSGPAQIHFANLKGFHQDINANLGDFNIRYSSKLDQLSIYQGKLVKYASPPFTSFIGGGVGQAKIEEVKGSFFVEENLKKRCLKQTIESITSIEGAFTLTGQLACANFTSDYKLKIFNSGGYLNLKLSFSNPEINRSYFNISSKVGEAIFGFGEQFTYFNLKGRRLPLLVMEQGIGRGAQPITAGANLTAKAGGDWHTSYASFPFYVTSRMQSLFLTNSEYSVFDLRHDQKTTVKVFAPEMNLRLVRGHRIKEIIEDFTRYSGRMRPLPKWITNGAIVGMQGGTARVEKVLQKLQKLKTPVSGFWLQDWVGQRTTTFGKQLWWNWELDKQHYSDWAGLIDKFKRNNIKVMTYINPFLADVVEKKNSRRNLFNEAKAKGYLTTKADGKPYLIENTSFSAGLLDLTNEKARIWFKQVIKDEVLAVGASGYMADFGEALPFDAKLANKVDAASYHNLYPQEWAKLNRELFDSLPNGDQLVFFSRAGYIQSPAYTTLFWLGDQMVSWDKYDGIKSSITGMLSGGISGYTLNHSDIGGYTTINHWLKNYHRSKELLFRWMELSAFTTIFRTHEGNRPSKNHQFYDDDESLQFFDRFAKVYQAWGFYRQQLIQEAAKTGLPVARHLFIEYPLDKNTYDLSHEQYLLGDQLLVAPVTEPGTSKKKVYLPKGTWLNVFTGDEYLSKQGRHIIVDAPLGKPAVFSLKNSIIGNQFRQNLKKANLL